MGVKKEEGITKTEESVRTPIHDRHFPDLPCGEVAFEGIRTTKHCTTTTKKSPRIKMGWKKQEERALFKNRISAANRKNKRKRSNKKNPGLGQKSVRT